MPNKREVQSEGGPERREISPILGSGGKNIKEDFPEEVTCELECRVFLEVKRRGKGLPKQTKGNMQDKEIR